MVAVLRPFVTSLLAAASLFAAASARAADPVHVTFGGDACPGADLAFFDALRREARGLSVAEPDAPARSLDVRIDRAGVAIIGALRITEVSGEVRTREVPGRSCEVLVSALALMTALAIDEGPPPGTKPPPRAISKPKNKPEEQGTAPRVEAPVKRAPSTFAIASGAQLVVLGASAPKASFGVAPFFDLSQWAPGLSLAVRFSLAVAESADVVTTAGRATFRLYAARVSGCPWALRVEVLLVRPCVGLDAGALHARGTGVKSPLDVWRPWASVTAGPRVQWLVTEGIRIEADGGLLFPLVRDHFVFQNPQVEIHEVPVASGFGAVGIGVVLP